MNKLSRINRIIKFSTERKIYDDNANKFRPHLVWEFNNKEQKIGTLFISDSLNERLSAWAQHWIRNWQRCRLLKKESYVSIKYPLELSLSSSRIEQKISQCPDKSFCLEEEEFEEILCLIREWNEENPEFIPITLKEKELEELREENK